MANKNTKILESNLTKVLINFIKLVVTTLPYDVINALKNAYSIESNLLAKTIYEIMFKNLNIATKYNIPLCQDTGILMFFVKAGTNSPFINIIPEVLIKATKEATSRIPLRPNAVDPITGVNSGDNTGPYIPWVNWELIPGNNDIEISLYIAGGGSSLPGIAKVFTPAKGLNGLVELILNVLVDYGVSACPPLFIGIGIGAKIGFDPKVIMLLITIPSGLAFMLPVGTPANAIAFSSGYYRIRDSVRAGLLVNIPTLIFFLLSAWIYWRWLGLKF